MGSTMTWVEKNYINQEYLGMFKLNQPTKIGAKGVGR